MSKGMFNSSQSCRILGVVFDPHMTQNYNFSVEEEEKQWKKINVFPIMHCICG
jgi:hypothetical protein